MPRKPAPKPRRAKPTIDTHAVIAGLFVNPPDGPEALRDRLAGVDPALARELLLDELADTDIDVFEAQLAGLALILVGVEPVVDVVVERVLDPSTREAQLIALATTLQGLEPRALEELLKATPELALRVFAAQLIMLLTRVQLDPRAARDVTGAVKSIPADDRAEYLRLVEATRARAGVRASDLYRDALGDPSLATDDDARELMLSAVVGDADADGAALLARLRDGAKGRLRDAFHRALVRLETARAARGPGALAEGVAAFASNPDGQGAVVCFLTTPNPDGTLTLVNLCVRLSEGVRDGYVDPRATAATRDAAIAHFNDEGSIELIPAPPGEVARLVAEAAERSRAQGLAIPEHSRRSVELFARVAPAEGPPLPPAHPAPRDFLEEAFDAPRFESWFFDDGDLDRFGADTGDDDADLATLARSPARERLVAMARYMARWSLWRGDEASAARWVAVADDVERDFARSDLARLMLTGSLASDDEIDDEVEAAPRAADRAPLADTPLSGIALQSFAHRFPEVAQREARTMTFDGRGPVPAGTYLLDEFYCADPTCDCERVMLMARSLDRGEAVATVSYAFNPQSEWNDGVPQIYLDPLHPRAPYAEEILEVLRGTLSRDRAWRDRLRSHYDMVKRSVAPKPLLRVGPKVGANDPCPCGSGKKYKKCCRP
ncbi:MAG: SEC-C metal-binding domain-containing protein [Polyangiales bacterium]